MPRSLPDLHALSLEEIDELIDLALAVKDKEMFKEYTSLKASMIADKTKSVWIDTYSGEKPLFVTTDNVDRINELTQEDVRALIDMAVELKDKVMFHEYSGLLEKMKQDKHKAIYRTTYENPHYDPSKPKNGKSLKDFQE